MATFSSKQYSWADFSIAYGGRILEGLTDVEYMEKQEKDYLRGRGSKPHQILHGNVDFEGKIKLWQSEVEAMIADAPGNDIKKLNFDIICTYEPRDGGEIVTDILKGCEFTELKKNLKQGDKNMEIELPIMFTDILYQQ